MPKVSRTRFNQIHEEPLTKRKFASEHCNPFLTTQLDSNKPINEILENLNDPKAYTKTSSEIRYQKTQQQQQQQRLNIKPYSKSYQKRIKKKLKDQSIIGNLNEFKQVLNELNIPKMSIDDDNNNNVDQKTLKKSTKEDDLKVNNNQRSEQQKSCKKSISVKQRAKVLQIESNRLPKILNHSEFIKNPFETIRIHLQNTQFMKSKSTIK